MTSLFDRRGSVAALACIALLFSASSRAQTTSDPFLSTLMFFNGSSPSGNVTLGSNGALYGPTFGSGGGGGAVGGLFYQLDPNAAYVKTVYQYGLEYDANLRRIFWGSNPSAQMLLASDGNFYGVTQNTVPYFGSGTIFRMTHNGSYAKLFEFDPLVVEGPHDYLANDTGAFPQASLIEGTEAGVHYLYGVTFQGGRVPDPNNSALKIPSGVGTIFKIRLDGTGFTVIHSFAPATRKNSVDENGDPIFENGVQKTEFDVNPDGRLKNPDGVNPNQRLLLGTDGRLYGVTTNGGANGTGVIFSLMTDGSDFEHIEFNASPETIGAPPADETHDPADPLDPYFGYNKRKLNVSGGYPSTSLVQIGGNIYGTTSALGAYPFGSPSPTGPPYSATAGNGTLFRIDPAVRPYAVQVVFDFTGGENDSLPANSIERRGSAASGNLITVDGTTIVGTTQAGGILVDSTDTAVKDIPGAGTVYTYNTTLPAADAFRTIVVFGRDAYVQGYSPAYGVIAVPEGSGYAYYGIANGGGTWGQGTVFKLGIQASHTAQGVPVPYDDGGGSIGKWLIAALLVLIALQLVAFRYRRARVQAQQPHQL